MEYSKYTYQITTLYRSTVYDEMFELCCGGCQMAVDNRQWQRIDRRQLGIEWRQIDTVCHTNYTYIYRRCTHIIIYNGCAGNAIPSIFIHAWNSRVRSITANAKHIARFHVPLLSLLLLLLLLLKPQNICLWICVVVLCARANAHSQCNVMSRATKKTFEKHWRFRPIDK